MAGSFGAHIASMVVIMGSVALAGITVFGHGEQQWTNFSNIPHGHLAIFWILLFQQLLGRAVPEEFG